MRLALSLIARALVVLLGSALITFLLLWNAPGDPAAVIAQARFDAMIDQEIIDEIRRAEGLDKTFWPAFLAWLGPLFLGDLGNSAVTGRPVLPDLVGALYYTVPLALAALAIGLTLSIPLALIATRNPGSFVDRFAIGLASLGTAIPAYWLGLLLILLFAVQLAWLSAMGARTPAHTILPAVTLGLGVTASLTRIIRSGILEAKGKPFLPALRRRRVTERDIQRDHVSRHAAIPVATVFGLELAFLIEGVVIVEVIFSRPGLGSFLVGAIFARDFPQVQAVVLFIAFVFVFVNLAVDVFYRVLDPRIGERSA
ncbi:MAG: ABC transporter permease [Pseudomonadota bacterium]